MRLTKHHGLGNDFLVLVDPDGRTPITESMATTVCDRHRGIGADGLLRVTRGSGEVQLAMTLLNADGSRAEMSGNGISCLVQAALLSGMATGDRIAVSTDAGLKTVTVVGRPAAGRHRLAVDMGAGKVGDDQPEWLGGTVLHATAVDMGNPHLVLHVGDPDDPPDLVRLGEAANRATPGGVNLELVTVGPGDNELTMQVYERGVGPTEACGTGACAAAVAAHAWELVGPKLTVHQPGGDVLIELSDSVRYEVEVEFIAAVQWELT